MEYLTKMKYETMMRCLRFTDETRIFHWIGDQVINSENGKRGPRLATLQQAVAIGVIEVNLANQLRLTDLGRSKLVRSDTVRLNVTVPKDRVAELLTYVSQLNM